MLSNHRTLLPGYRHYVERRVSFSIDIGINAESEYDLCLRLCGISGDLPFAICHLLFAIGVDFSRVIELIHTVR